jgi:hypothetical protein
MEELEDGVRERRIRQDGAPEHFGLRQDCIATLSDLNATWYIKIGGLIYIYD